MLRAWEPNQTHSAYQVRPHSKGGSGKSQVKKNLNYGFRFGCLVEQNLRLNGLTTSKIKPQHNTIRNWPAVPINFGRKCLSLVVLIIHLRNITCTTRLQDRPMISKSKCYVASYIYIYSQVSQCPRHGHAESRTTKNLISIAIPGVNRSASIRSHLWTKVIKPIKL